MGKDGTSFLRKCHELMYLSVLSACQALYGCCEVPNTFTIWTLCQHTLLGTKWQTHTDTHWDTTCELRSTGSMSMSTEWWIIHHQQY